MWQKNGVSFKNPLLWNDRQIWNPSSEQLAAAGYVEVADPQPDYTQLRVAFARFRAICAAIGKLLGNEKFRGGTDEVTAALARPEAKTEAGKLLAAQLTAADKDCTLAAQALGIGQPQGWYMCWRIPKK